MLRETLFRGTGHRRPGLLEFHWRHGPWFGSFPPLIDSFSGASYEAAIVSLMGAGISALFGTAVATRAVGEFHPIQKGRGGSQQDYSLTEQRRPVAGDVPLVCQRDSGARALRSSSNCGRSSSSRLTAPPVYDFTRRRSAAVWISMALYA
jgi:hypothetical protein